MGFGQKKWPVQKLTKGVVVYVITNKEVKRQPDKGLECPGWQELLAPSQGDAADPSRC